MIEFFQKMFAYDAWCNERVYTALAALPEPGRGADLYAHVVTSQRMWLARIAGSDTTSMSTFPMMSIEETHAESGAVREAWDQLLSSATEERLDYIVCYHNQRGEYYETPLREIMTHIINHGTYHRGQIASAIREVGGVPPSTDYIVFIRI